MTAANVVFCDGHGEHVTPDAIGYRKGTDGAYIDDGSAPGGPPFNTVFSGRYRDDDPPELPT